MGRCLLLGSSLLDRWRQLQVLVPGLGHGLACWLGQEQGLWGPQEVMWTGCRRIL